MVDLDEEEQPEVVQKKPSHKLKLIGLLASLLFIAALLLVRLLPVGDKGHGAVDGSEESSAESVEYFYHEMKPVFVVNLPGHPSVLQIGIDIRTTSSEMIEFLKYNDPMLRHNLLNLLQGQDAQLLYSRDGKERLREAMTDEIKRVLAELSAPGGIDAIFFTSFIMQ